MSRPGRPLPSRPAALAALAVVGLLLAGCGGGTTGGVATSTSTAVAVSTDAPAGASAVEGGTATVDTTTSSGDGGATPSGVVDLDAELARTQEVADSIVGHTEHDAQQLVESKGLRWRVGQREGRTFSLTMDLRPDRITVVVDEGRVTKATAG